jgi:hypothetical protein
VASTLQIIAAVRASGVGASDYRIAVSIAPALKSYMRSVAEGDDEGKWALIQRDFTISLTDGAGSLSAAYVASPTLIASDGEYWAVLVDGEAGYSSWLPDRQSISLGRIKFTSYFCVDGDTLRTRDRNGSLTGFTGVNATVSGPAILSLANLPSQLQDEFVAAVVAFVEGGEG